MLKLEVLPAGHGDCLWLEYGDPAQPRRILIDGGTKGTYTQALRPKLRERPSFELLVVTHIDADHIGGSLELLEDAEAGFQAKDIWFNGFRHLPDEAPETMGPVQGERLTDLLVKPGVRWNHAFKREAVVVPESGDLPRVELEGGLVLTVLSPTPARLAALKPQWEKEVLKAGLDPNRIRPEEAEDAEDFQLLGGPPDVDELVAEPFSEDGAPANGSSIGLLVEYQGRRLLLGADAYPSVLRAAVNRLTGGKKLALDACKLPHHGSKSNVSRELINALDCPVYVLSSNGAYFKHPDRQAVARVIKHGGPKVQLVFNYRTKHNEMWDSKPLRQQHGYTTAFPASAGAGVTLEWA